MAQYRKKTLQSSILNERISALEDTTEYDQGSRYNGDVQGRVCFVIVKGRKS